MCWNSDWRRWKAASVGSHWHPDKPLPPAQAETLRKMLLAVVADVRLVTVRLAEDPSAWGRSLTTDGDGEVEVGPLAAATVVLDLAHPDHGRLFDGIGRAAQVAQ